MRKYYIDWLRVTGILLLFPFHTARVFDPWETNYVTDTPNAFSGWFLGCTHFWFMPLLFLIAGFSAFYALQKRSPGEFARERVSRLLIPFLAGMALIVPPQAFMAKITHTGYTGSYLQFLGGYFSDFKDFGGYTGGLTPAHLWFILYLFVYSLALLPLLILLKRKIKLPQYRQGLARLAQPWVLLLAYLPMTIAEAVPFTGIKNPIYFAMFFLLGFLFASHEDFSAAIRRMRFRLLLILLPVMAVYFYLGGLFGWPSGYSLPSILLVHIRNFACIIILYVLLGYGEKFLDRDSAALRYLNRAAFPVYVLHQTVLFAIAFYIVRTNWDPALKFLAIMLPSLIACFALYEVFRRFRAARWMLGIK